MIIKPQPGPQTEFLASNASIAVYGGSSGGGKANSCRTITRCLESGMSFEEAIEGIKNKSVKIDSADSFVLDWKGDWKSFSEIKIGDIIINPDGQLQYILNINEVGIEQCYLFEFEDQTKVECSENHLWAFWIAGVNSRRKTSFGYKPCYSNLVPYGWNKNYITRARVRDAKYLIEEVKKNNKIIIPICAPLNFTARARGNSDRAYVYGAFIGDGYFRNYEMTAHIKDRFILDEIIKISKTNNLEIKCYPKNNNILRLSLRKISWLKSWVQNNKFSKCVSNSKRLPKGFQRASLEFRYSLAQGLFDTDGYVGDKNREVSYCTVSELLAQEVAILIRTLGYMAKIRKKDVNAYTYKGQKKYGQAVYIVRVEGNHLDLLFRLPRKVERAKKHGQFNDGKSWVGKRIISITPTQKEYCRCISVSNPNGLYITDGYNVTHNSYALLLEPLYHYDNSEFGAVIFRRNSTQVRNEGGLWDESMKIYPLVKGKPRESTMQWEFPSGARVKFAHLEYDKTCLDYQGAQIPLLCYDELVHFSKYQFFYMLSRNRSSSGVPGYVRATCNPDVNSWVRKLIDWYIGQDGYPIKSRSGVIRWFIHINDELIWADTKKELEDKYGTDSLPKSFTFISALIYDNKILMQKDPAYLANLKALSRVERERLLMGNWNVQASAGLYFKAEWFEIVDAIPSGWVQAVRYWDRASTKVSESNNDPDYTCGIKLYKYLSGIFIIVDMRRVQESPLQVERMISNTAAFDSTSVTIGIEQDPGSSGVADAQNYVRLLQGYDVRVVRPSTDKETRARPVSAQCEAGNIKVFRSPWNQAFFSELENFPKGRHDDQVDVLSGAFNLMTQGVSILDAF